MNKTDIVVVIPIYKSSLSVQEIVSLKRCMDVLSDYEIVAITPPQNMDIEALVSRYGLSRAEMFPDEYFSSRQAYNRLVMDESFYQRFADYEYLLIYQLDAYVFRDDLLCWAQKGYDYVGAPWIPDKDYYLKGWRRHVLRVKRTVYKLFRRDRLRKAKYCFFEVGNGGFSLRRISKFIDITRHYRSKINRMLGSDDDFYPEDVFLLWELSDKGYELHKPDYCEALTFSMEMNPAWCYSHNGGQLPFGCHAWYCKSNASFWSKLIVY